MIDVLVLEDEEYTRQFFKKLLFDLPQVSEVFDTSDSRDAIRLAKEHCPDLVLLDIELNGQDMNGLEVAKQIYSFDKDAYLVFVTGYTQYALDSITAVAGPVLKIILHLLADCSSKLSLSSRLDCCRRCCIINYCQVVHNKAHFNNKHDYHNQQGQDQKHFYKRLALFILNQIKPPFANVYKKSPCESNHRGTSLRCSYLTYPVLHGSNFIPYCT